MLYYVCDVFRDVHPISYRIHSVHCTPSVDRKRKCFTNFSSCRSTSFIGIPAVPFRCSTSLTFALLIFLFLKSPLSWYWTFSLKSTTYIWPAIRTWVLSTSFWNASSIETNYYKHCSPNKCIFIYCIIYGI